MQRFARYDEKNSKTIRSVSKHYQTKKEIVNIKEVLMAIMNDPLFLAFSDQDDDVYAMVNILISYSS